MNGNRVYKRESCVTFLFVWKPFSNNNNYKYKNIPSTSCLSVTRQSKRNFLSVLGRCSFHRTRDTERNTKHILLACFAPLPLNDDTLNKSTTTCWLLCFAQFPLPRASQSSWIWTRRGGMEDSPIRAVQTPNSLLWSFRMCPILSLSNIYFYLFIEYLLYSYLASDYYVVYSNRCSHSL